jgi:hypothetical protein
MECNALRREYGMKEGSRHLAIPKVRLALSLYVIREMLGRRIENFDGPIWRLHGRSRADDRRKFG